MTFEQLEYFIAVVQHDTFFDAAETLHVSQSALSKQIMRLEKELGVALLDRSKRRASLTQAGSIFYQEALELNSRCHQALSRLEEYRVSQNRRLCLGTLPILTQYHLTPKLKAFQERFPDTDVIIEEVEEQELMKGLEDGSYDMVIAREHMIHPRKYKTWKLAEDRLAAVLPSGHPLALTASGQPRTAITLKELAGERFILMNRYTSIYQLCMEEFQKQKLSVRIARTARVESIISAVAVNDGVSLLPESNFEVFHHENVTAIPIHPVIPLPVVLVQNGRGHASRASSRESGEPLVPAANAALREPLAKATSPALREPLSAVKKELVRTLCE